MKHESKKGQGIWHCCEETERRLEKGGVEMMTCGFNGVVDPNPEVLSTEELNLFLAVLKKILETEDAGAPKKGSIALYSQKRSEEPKCVFIVNLEEGEEMVVCSDGEHKSSAYLADEAAKDLLNWPECKRYDYVAESLEFGQLTSGIHYGGDDYCALALNTTLGRFVMSSYVGFADKTLPELKTLNGAVLMVMAEMFWQLRPRDILLNDSRRYMELKELLYPYLEKMKQFVPAVKEIFYRRAGYIPELEAWEKWRREEMKKLVNELEMYF